MKKFLLPVILLVLLAGFPILGLLGAGKSVSHYFEFPPLTRYVTHAPFSWGVFGLLSFLGVLVSSCMIFQLKHFQTAINPKPDQQSFKYPWWGVLGLIALTASWILAWNRFDWFAPFQVYTFLPIWLGYILIVNAITFQRTGSCLLIDRPLYFLTLFPVSAVFWWFFEYLNRFVQNWYYLGIEDFSATEYVVHASLCFTTVLPAVVCTEELLGTIHRLKTPFMDTFKVDWGWARFTGIILLLLSGLGLAGIGLWPDLLFPLVWISPFMIIISVQMIIGQATFLAPVRRGDWRVLWLPALSALICGFFWELWNVKSYAHWEYSVPFVQKFHIFEMPVLGYLGYLPFGLECKAIVSVVGRYIE